tara:strand:- start:1735 stop:4389 length:2655 start_codon:yes stop_codon:yes gene_type:complete
MDTILINCSKDKAKVYDDNGRFMNEVSQGIVVNKGDRISLEGIAVNSTGVGTNVIEVPQTLKGFPYQPFSTELKCSYYIHHNHNFTCRAPTTSPAISIYPAGTAKYGYLNKASEPVGTNIQDTKALAPQEVKSGMKFYVMGLQDTLDEDNPTYETGSLPYEGLYRKTFVKLKCEVPVGYDSPQNIAANLTTQLHKVSPAPFNYNYFGGLPTLTGFFPGVNNPTSGYVEASATADTGITRMVAANWSGDMNGAGDQNKHYNSFAVGNPALWEYGCQAFSVGLCQKNMTHINAAATNPGYLSDVYHLYDFPLNAGNTAMVINEGYVITTSINYNFLNCSLISKFIQSQKNYSGSGGKLNTKELKKAPGWFGYQSLIRIGRVNDSAPGSALTAPCYAPVSANYDANPIFFNLITTTFYKEELYDKAYLGADAIAKGAVLGIQGSNAPLINVAATGGNYTPKQLAAYMNVNFIPVKTANNEWNIGIIVEGLDGLTAAKAGGRNYCLFDLGFYNLSNPVVYLLNPNKWKGAPAGGAAATYNNVIQLGAPNAQVAFDGDRGRFYLSNFHWAHRIGSKASTTAVPEAENVVVSVNYAPTQFIFNAGTITPFIKYAECGVAIEGIGLFEKDGKGDAVYLTGETYGVEFEPPLWKKSLFGRLGFDYNQLFSKFGRVDSIFNPKFYETTLPTFEPSFFPSPITTNPEMDSAMSLALSVNTSALPMYDLNVEGGELYIQPTVSSVQIYANNLPNKLVFPYWLIYSDIINGITFHSVEDGEQDNIIAVCNRAYISGDFAFSFATDYTFTATKDYVISGITTQILNPDLSPADIDDGTSVIYKIEKPIPMFQVNNNQANKPKNAVEYSDSEKRKGHSHREGFKRNPVIDRKDATEMK